MRTLVADDHPLAREGLRVMLACAPDVEVVGEVDQLDDVVPSIRRSEPDVVLLDLIWDHSAEGALALIPIIRRDAHDVRLIAVSGDDSLLDRARAAGAQGALDKTFRRDTLLRIMRTMCAPRQEVDRAAPVEEFSERLSRVSVGAAGAREYEVIMRELLPRAFAGELIDFEFQRKHRDGEQIWDGVAFNVSSEPFWSTIRNLHDAGQVIFEMKNVTELKRRDVLQAHHYLIHPVFRFAFLITRVAPPESVMRDARRLWEQDRRVIVFLSDQDLLATLRARAAGNGSDEVVRPAYLALTRNGWRSR
jgi:DNA-binding NarL/FixJ family response regulator